MSPLRNEIETKIAELDDLLDEYAAALGSDAEAYRNHTYRVVNLCCALAQPDASQHRRIVIAAAFHDIGIWSDGTFDYLEPSRQRACAHLEQAGEHSWTAEVGSMVFEHHKVFRYRELAGSLVEPFRRADWADVSLGFFGSGLSRTFIREVFSAFPSAGFHTRLAVLALERWRSHPFSPLPMLRL